jgi:hypothetical protein
MRLSNSWVLIGALGGIVPKLDAQSVPASKWSAAVGIALLNYSGASAASGVQESMAFVPHRPTVYQLRVERRVGPIALGVRLSHSQPGVSLSGAEQSFQGPLLLVAERAFTVTSVAPEVGIRLLGAEGGNRLRGRVGVELEQWSFDEEAARHLVTPRAGLSFHAPVTRRLEVVIEGETGYSSSSPFNPSDLPEGFRQAATWRWGIGGGVAVRW